MTDLLTTLSNLSGEASPAKQNIIDEIKLIMDEELVVVERLLKQSRQLYSSGSKTEAQELLDIGGELIQNVKRLQKVVSEIVGLK